MKETKKLLLGLVLVASCTYALFGDIDAELEEPKPAQAQTTPANSTGESSQTTQKAPMTQAQSAEKARKDELFKIIDSMLLPKGLTNINPQANRHALCRNMTPKGLARRIQYMDQNSGILKAKIGTDDPQVVVDLIEEYCKGY